MNKYVLEIEKKAGFKDKAIGLASKHKNKLIIGAAGAGTLGAGYAVADDKTKAKLREGGNFLKNSLIAGGINSRLQDAVKYGGGIAGTAYGMKKGKSMGKALSTNGLVGMAIGDMAGSAGIPLSQLYKNHKKEFGTAPDAKSVGAILAANTLPTAAIWGTLYGTKKGINKRKAIAKNMSSGADEISKATNKYMDIVSKVQGYDGEEVTRKTLRKATGLEKKLLKNKRKMNAINYSKEFKDYKDFTKYVFDNSGGKIGPGVKKIVSGFAPIAIADQLAGIPASVAAPKNIVNIKKKRLENSENKNEI